MDTETTRQKAKMPHILTLENRKKLKLTGISNVESFDDKNVLAFTDLGELLICGKNLNITKLTLETGNLEVEGEISSLTYNENTHKNGSFFSKIFK